MPPVKVRLAGLPTCNVNGKSHVIFAILLLTEPNSRCILSCFHPSYQQHRHIVGKPLWLEYRRRSKTRYHLMFKTFFSFGGSLCSSTCYRRQALDWLGSIAVTDLARRSTWLHAETPMNQLSQSASFHDLVAKYFRYCIS